ncbi:MAG TPA: hypothetical protein VMM12_04185 [Longimicrobiales bacterium]|nr:hypothetical protein [Longimicrobiales bacterium]
MTTIVAVLAFAALFAGFGILAPVLRRKRCGGGGCGSCAGDECKIKELMR